jgi:tetratricopeptide (TPR) repeat protein
MMTKPALSILAASLVLTSLAGCNTVAPNTVVPETQPPDSPELPSAQAEAELAAAFATYEAARGDGLSDAECEQLAAGFDEVYAAHPKSMAIARFNAGVVWEECGDAAKAKTIYEELAAKNHPLALNNLGVLAWNAGDHEQALRLFERAVKADKLQSVWSRNNVAAAYRDRYAETPALDHFTTAERQLQNVLALDSSNKAAYENLARLYYDRGRLEDRSYLVLAHLVVTQAKRVLERENRASADIRNIEGLLYMQDDNQIDALRAFNAAVEIEPKHADANRNIGFIAIRFRDYANAERAFTTALESSEVERDLEVYIAMGVAKRGLRKFDEAEEWYRKALALEPDDPRPWYNLGILTQDHLTGREGLDQTAIESLYDTSKQHFGEFIEKAESDERYATAVQDARDRVVIINDALAALKAMDQLQRDVDEAMRRAAIVEEERREHLRELERQAAAKGDPSMLEQLEAEAAAEAAQRKVDAKAEKAARAAEDAARAAANDAAADES